MSKKRGLSVDEKREKMLQIFHESRDVYVLKDLEKLGPKKGVISQSVKEIVQTLVDDDLVHLEKIGASNYYWAFPSEAAVKLEARTRKAEAQLQELEGQEARLQKQVAESQSGKEDSDSRTQKLATLSELKAKVSETEAKLAQYAGSDPEKVKELGLYSNVAKEAANRWLDNTYALQSWLAKRFDGNGMEEQLKSFFQENGLTDDIDYIE